MYGAALHACTRSRDGVTALQLLQQMSEESVKPNVVCFSSAILACGKAGDALEAENLFQAMPVRQLQPNSFTYAAVIHAHCCTGDVQSAWRRLGDMRAAGFSISTTTTRPFLKAMRRAGPETTRLVFETMLQSQLPTDQTFHEGVMQLLGVEETYGLLRRYKRIQ